MKNFFLGCLATLLVAPAAAFIFLWSGLYPVNADTAPLWLERKLAHMAVEAHVERQAAKLTNPFSSSPEVLSAGMQAFKSNCAGCHGSPTHKDSTFADALYPKAPQFGLKGLKHDLRETFWVTKHGIRMSGMPAFGAMLSDEDIWKIAIFLGSIETLEPEIKAQWETAN